MGSGLAKKFLYLMTMLVKGASATHLPSHQAHISQFAEEGALQCSFESEGDHIAVAEWRERTRLCSTVWTDMEESTTSSQAAFHIFFITREREEDDTWEKFTQMVVDVVLFFQLLLAESKMRSIILDGHILNIKD